MKLHLNYTLGIALLTSISSVAIAAETTYLSKENYNSYAVSEYWTPERMKNAKPMPMPKANPEAIEEVPVDKLPKAGIQSGDGAAPIEDIIPELQQLYTPVPNEKTATNSFDRGTLKFDYTSSRLIPITADQSYPYRVVGKLFFTIPNRGDFVCSASVLRPRVILTAGHCVHSGANGSDGFYTNWKFVPAFRDGTAPFFTWNWAYVTVTSTWSTGGGVVPNAADYAMIEPTDLSINGVLRTIGSYIGYLGYQTLSLIPNHTTMLGYPCNLDSCSKMHQVMAQSARAVSPNNAEYGTDAGGGSSGGPWVQNFGALAAGSVGGSNPGLNRVVGVTSYGYTDPALRAQGAAIFDQRFIDLLNKICAHKAGNC